MLRFVIQRHEVDGNMGKDWRDMYTIDIDVPEIEAALQRGGSGPLGFERYQLLGVEILPTEKREE